VAREAIKQCGRAWLPRFLPPLPVAELARTVPGTDLAVLDPRAGLPFDLWLRSLRPSPADLGTEARPIVLAVGPEGGLSAGELELLAARGASLVWLAPHVLRIETAAEAAMAVAGAVHGARAR
jgi:16S rRNA (uracil1498-N3)-methyltransferase